jgi:hypothetical protein
MKYLLLFGMVLAGLVLVQFAQGQTVDELLDKYAAARGGLDKLSGIKSIYMEGARQMMGNEVTVKVTKEQGKLSRTEFEMGAGNGFMLITDKEGWNMFSMRSPTPTQLPEDAVKAQQTELDIAGPLVNCTAKGHKAELVGKEPLEGTDCYKIKLTTAQGKEVMYWLDAKSYLLLQSSVKRTGRGGAAAEGEMLTLYGDYKAVDGILFPHTIQNKMTGNTQGGGGGMANGSTTFDKIELNGTVDAKLYKPE